MAAADYVPSWSPVHARGVKRHESSDEEDTDEEGHAPKRLWHGPRGFIDERGTVGLAPPGANGGSGFDVLLAAIRAADTGSAAAGVAPTASGAWGGPGPVAQMPPGDGGPFLPSPSMAGSLGGDSPLPRGGGSPGRPARAPSKPRRGLLTLRDLIDAKVVTPGKAALTMDYKGKHFAAQLGDSGEITYNGAPFSTPSAWCLTMMRIVTPDKVACSGWASVRHNGALLGELRRLLQERGCVPGAARAFAPGGPSVAGGSPSSASAGLHLARAGVPLMGASARPAAPVAPSSSSSAGAGAGSAAAAGAPHSIGRARGSSDGSTPGPLPHGHGAPGSHFHPLARGYGHGAGPPPSHAHSHSHGPHVFHGHGQAHGHHHHHHGGSMGPHDGHGAPYGYGGYADYGHGAHASAWAHGARPAAAADATARACTSVDADDDSDGEASGGAAGQGAGSGDASTSPTSAGDSA